MKLRCLLALMLLAASGSSALADAPAVLPVPAHGVIGVTPARMTADYWIARAPQADDVLMSAAKIAGQNARVLARDPSMHDLSKIPLKLGRQQVRQWITGLSRLPDHVLYDLEGQRVGKAALQDFRAQLDLDAIPDPQDTRYGLIVHRASLRTFPTDTRVFSSSGDTDIDRFQETGVFPGTPVVIAHASRNKKWLFVVSPRYAAWVHADAVAEGDRDVVLGYSQHKHARVVTGAQVRTVFTPEQPQLSQLVLDMGVRIPLATGLDPAAPVNGQSAYTSWTLSLPIRNDDGSLVLKPALLQRIADSRSDYLPMTRGNIIRQAFKFLGERYGWGHMYDGRDCSGFVSEVYRSMGAQMPRNTSAQSVSPALEHQTFGKDDDHAARMRAVNKLQIGDLVYIPGHVMLVIGHVDGKPWVIHDVSGIRYRTADGEMRHVKLNEVSVTPLEPLLYNDHSSFIDHMTSIVRVAR